MDVYDVSDSSSRRAGALKPRPAKLGERFHPLLAIIAAPILNPFTGVCQPAKIGHRGWRPVHKMTPYPAPVRMHNELRAAYARILAAANRCRAQHQQTAWRKRGQLEQRSLIGLIGFVPGSEQWEAYCRASLNGSG